MHVNESGPRGEKRGVVFQGNRFSGGAYIEERNRLGATWKWGAKRYGNENLDFFLPIYISPTCYGDDARTG
jgi:hypothetical protein